VTDLRPATPADAAILALHHHRQLLNSGSPEDAATRTTQVFLPWARTQLEAGGLIAIVAGGGLEAAGSVALHHVERPAGLESAELLYLHAPVTNARELEVELVQALLLEARLRGITRITTQLSHLAAHGFTPSTSLEWRAQG
jgi:hypothetical protein